MRPSLANLIKNGQGLSGFPWPESCGDWPFRIAANGQWYYQNSPIGRIELVKLFATILQRDDQGDYWLVTPVERGRIQVDDLPMTIVECEVMSQMGRDESIRMRTNLDHWVVLGLSHPMKVDYPAALGGEPRPSIFVRDGLWARINRPVFYELVEMATLKFAKSNQAEQGFTSLWITSQGEDYCLGSWDE